MDLNKLRKHISEIIDDIKYHSDSLTDLERLPVIQLKVLLAKLNKLTEKTTILLHYVELKGTKSALTSPMEIKKGIQKSKTIEQVKIEVEPKVEESITENQEDKDVDSSSKTVTDLMSAIGVNEKYLFSSTLFEGDLEVFKSIIEELNNISSLNDAKIKLDALNQKYNWDSENAVTLEFIELIHRSFDAS